MFRGNLMSGVCIGAVAAGEPPSSPLAPLFYDNFDSYADGTRLIAGDPNANAGLVATNPGNLGWQALTTLAADNSRFNMIVYQGKVRNRTTNSFGAATYLLSPGIAVPVDTVNGWQTVRAVVAPLSGQESGFNFRASNQQNRVSMRNNNGSSINLRQIISGTDTSIGGVSANTGLRKMGGNSNGTMRLFNDADETITVISYYDGAAWRALLRRGPGIPIGPFTGYTFTDPAGSYFGFGSSISTAYANTVDMLEVSTPKTVMFLNETFNAWYPKRKAAAGDPITTGSAAINFSGTYAGAAPSRLQWALFDPETGATVKGWAWVPLASQTIGGGNWSVSNLVIPVGLNGRKAYAIGIRPVDADNNHDAAAAIVSIKHFYVALNVALIGQSNSGGITANVTSGNYPDFPGSCTYQRADPPNQASTNAAGYPIGATSITLASFGAGAITVGEYIQFAGSSYRYKIVTGDTDVSNGGTIVIESPGLLAAIPASNTLIYRSGPVGTYGENTAYYTSTTDLTQDKCTARLGDALSALLNIPVCFEVMAIPATGMVNLGPTGVNWNYILTHHANAGSAFEMLYLSQGENEMVSQGNLWQGQWVDINLPAYLALSGQPAGTVIPLFLAWTGRGPSSGSATNASTQALRLGQDGFVAYANAQLGGQLLAKPGHHYVGAKMIDGQHYVATIGNGYDEVTRRIALSVLFHLGASAYDGMGPIALSASRAGADVTVSYNLNGATSMTCRDGTDQTLSGNAAALTGWQVSTDNFATLKTISGVALVGNDVVITLAADPGAPVQVRNHYGYDPDVTSWAFGAYADGTFIGSKPIITPLVSN